MRVVTGFDAGRAALARGEQRVWDTASPDTLDRIAALFGEPLTPRQAVQRVLDAVRAGGDAAVRRYAALLEGHTPAELTVPPDALRRAYDDTPAELQRALHTAAARIRAYHERCLPSSWLDAETGLGERYTAMARAGVYAPGGQAAYPSTVLMTAIPARVAGVGEVWLATPSQGEAGPNPAVLAAAWVAGVDGVVPVGGAQAIAALAYGTESIPRVDIVCGPGNIFVTLAKQMVYGEVAVDGLYGPTETMVIADGSADPEVCAADLLAQAEHDALASPMFVTTSRAMLDAVTGEVQRQLAALPRRDVAAAAVAGQGVAVLVDTLGEAAELANLYAPEHLCLLVDDPHALLPLVRNAGGVFLGDASPEVAGDYVAGPSHVMPTGGTARFSSPLGVHQFLKVTSVIALAGETFQALGADAARLAEAEGLDGHALAARMRLDRSPATRPGAAERHGGRP